jgi:protein O-mannosyl-transferase
VRWRIFSIAAIAFASHLNSLPGAFHYDDAHSISENVAIRHAANILQFFVDPALFSSESSMAMYRPLVVLSYALNYAFSGLSPLGYLFFNLLLHALVAVVVLLFLEQWLARASIAWWGAAVFALHPVNAQVVNYISSRSEGLAALGALGALYLLHRQARLWACFSYVFALLSKSQALVLLPLLWVVDRGGDNWRQRLWRWAPFAVITGLYLSLIYGNRFLPRSLAQDVRALDVQFFTQIKALVYYLLLFVFPHNLSVEHALSEGYQLQSAAVFFPLLLLVSMLFLALRSKIWPARGALFWLAAMSLTSLVPLNVLVNEHRLYIGSIGLTAGALGCIAAMPRRPLVWAGLVYLLLIGALTWQRNEVWRDEYALWQDANNKAPNAFRVQSNFGLALLEKGLPEQAKTVLEKAVQANPHYARTWNNLALAYEVLGAYTLAESAYSRAIELNPKHVGFRANLGRLYLGQGRYGEAIGVLDAALKIDPNSWQARVNMGLAHQRAGRVGEAIAQYERALAAGGLSAEAFNNLGLAYQDQDRLDEAERAFLAALRQEPGDFSLQINLRTLQLRKRGLAGVDLYEMLVEEFPQQANLWRMAAREYASLGRLQEAINACEKILALEPNDAQTKRNIERLKERLARGAD